VDLTFLGAAGTVTGSKYLVRDKRSSVMVDCGVFQGLKRWRLLNWEPIPVHAVDIDAVVLTHAHLDHVGALPLLFRQGFRRPVYCTAATRDLAELVLLDSARLHEEDARHAQQHGYSKHASPLPLYTQEDAEQAIAQFRPVRFSTPVEVAPGIEAVFTPAGHIPGAASILLSGTQRVLFSGDLGRGNDSLIRPPETPDIADCVVVESTYGDREHPTEDGNATLAQVIVETAARGGSVLVPTFAIARAQQLILQIHRLRRAGRIPHLPVFLDSPMAERATELFLRHVSELKIDPAEFREALTSVQATSTPADSRQLGEMHYPRIILSASGMATGGRVLHHLRQLAAEPRNSILLAGFQAAGTRGAALRDGAREIKLHGQYVPVNAQVVQLQAYSAHADARELLEWLARLPMAPRLVCITHGEPQAADTLRRRITERFGWNCRIPEYRDRYDLGELQPLALPLTKTPGPQP